MDRPYVFCHMMTSIDGRIMGNYMDTPEGEAAGAEFYRIAFGENPHYRHQGWLVLNGGTVWLRYHIKRINAGGK